MNFENPSQNPIEQGPSLSHAEQIQEGARRAGDAFLEDLNKAKAAFGI